MPMIRRVRGAGRSRVSGFSMIEVLIALLVLAIGLLGFALLQTMNLRYTQSAQLRTQATNLAYDLLDQMRANRFQAAWYGGAGFSAGEVDPASAECDGRPTGTVSIEDSITRWRCQVVRTLGPSARAGVSYDDGQVSVVILWGDQRWDQDNPSGETQFELATRL